MHADSWSFEKLYDTYWQKLYIYSYRILKDQQVCEDLIQELFLSFWKRRKEVEVENINAYLYQALRFQIYKYYRDTNFETLDIQNLADCLAAQNATDDYLQFEDAKKQLESHLSLLPKRCREIFVMSRYQNLSHKEIAAELKISIQTVKNQITTATKHLSEHRQEIIWLLLLAENL